MNKCIVIGGGFAGLTAASYLANKNIKVDLFEASPKLGGRAYSFLAKDGRTIIDNGQHILMGCYSETLRFFKLIHASNNLFYQPELEINFLKEGFEQFRLKAFKLPHPFNLIFGLLNFRAVSLSDRIRILNFFLKIFSYSEKELNRLNVEQLLKKEKQSVENNKAFWDIITIGALNTSTRKASAKTFVDILKRIFFGGRYSANIVIPKYGLTETYCDQAQIFIERKGGSVFTSRAVTKLSIENNRIVEIQTDKGIISDFDFVISAIPFYALKKIISTDCLSKNPELRYSSILSVHVWLNENPLKKQFYGLINSPLHWIFNKGSHLSLVISDADYLIEKSKEDILDLVKKELYKSTGIDEKNIVDFQIIKEKRATFIPAENIIDSRPSVITNLENLFVAGDWVNTGLPSTIESAVKSGKLASDAILYAKSCKFNFYNQQKKNHARKS